MHRVLRNSLFRLAKDDVREFIEVTSMADLPAL